MIHLRSCKLTNFKSYRDEVKIDFSSKITYVLGPNNSGKTTLLEAIHTPNASSPHRSPTTVRRIGDEPLSPHSMLRLSFSTTGEALREFLLGAPREFGIRGGPAIHSPSYIHSLLAEPELRFDFVVNEHGAFVAWCSWFERELLGNASAEYAQYRSRPDIRDFDYGDRV